MTRLEGGSLRLMASDVLPRWGLHVFATLPLGHDTTRHDPSLWHGNWAVLQSSACGLQRATQDKVSRMAIAMMMMMMHPQRWYR